MDKIINRIVAGENYLKLCVEKEYADEDEHIEKFHAEAEIIVQNIYELFLLKKTNLTCHYRKSTGCSICNVRIIPIIETGIIRPCYDCCEMIIWRWRKLPLGQVTYKHHMLLKEITNCDVSVVILRCVSFRPSFIVKYKDAPDDYIR
jgi:hypothetical protein